MTPEEVQHVRYPLPKSWVAATGILKGKRHVDALKHQKQIRKEWEQRSKKFAKMLPR